MPRRRSFARRCLRPLAVAALLALAVAGTARSQTAAPPGPRDTASVVVRIDLNGRSFARGVAVLARPPEQRLALDLADLRTAVDGNDAQRRLRLRDGGLYAVRAGGCADCSLRVRRTVLISSRLERIGGRLYVPMDDVVRALEGRLSTGGSPDVYEIHVGVCNWCILEPVEGEG